MQNQSTAIIAKPKLLFHAFWVFFGAVSLFIGVFSIGKPIGNYPEWLSPWVFHLFAIGAGLLSLAKWMLLKTIILRKDELEVTNLFGLNRRTIPRSQVLSMVEIVKKGEESTWKECLLKTNYGEFKFSENMHTAYAELMHILREQWHIKETLPLLK